MTADEKKEWQREVAAAVFMAMYTGKSPQAGERSHVQDYAEAARCAALAFSAAAAFVAEAELHSGPVDETGEEIDPRSLDPKCAHGFKFSDQCPLCDQNTGNAPEVATPPPA